MLMQRTTAWSVVFFGLSALMLAITTDAGERDGRGSNVQSVFPKIELTEEAQGQRAIDQLGERLGEVASAYGMSNEQLRSLLLQDSTLWVDRRGRLFYKEKQGGAEQPLSIY